MRSLQGQVRVMFIAAFTMLFMACSSSVSAVKQLDESSVGRMVASYLNTSQYEISLDQVLPLLVMNHSRDDYRTGQAGVYGPLLKRFLEQGFLTQTASTTTYPEISGTFAGTSAAFGYKYLWILDSVPGTNELRGQCRGPASIDAAQGTVEPDGKVTLYCAGIPQPAQYVEDGPNAYLKFVKGSIPISQAGTFRGHATGKKVTVTWYAYALTPKFKALMKHLGYVSYVVAGKYEVGKVTNLRLDTDTLASANFAYTVSLNSVGKLFYPSGGIGGEGMVTFGKKPDQTWAINAVTGIPRSPAPVR